MRDLDLTTYLRRRGISLEALAKYPEAAAELPRVVFLERNYLAARSELRRYTALVVAAPVSVPMIYFLKPSHVMLGCSLGFAAIVIGTSITQIVRRRRTMRDYVWGLERLVLLVERHKSRRTS